MIRLPEPAPPLSGLEQYALDLLIDLARLVPAPGVDLAVQLELLVGGHSAADLRTRGAQRWGLVPGDGVVRVPLATLAQVGALVTAAAERASSRSDRHGRVPASENALVAAGLERHAVVSRAALALRQAVVEAAGRRPVRLVVPWPEGRRWAVALTHDLDLVAWWPAAVLRRTVELAGKGRPGLAARALAGALAGASRDPVWRAVGELLAAESDHQLRSTWFLLCETPTWSSLLAGDVTYRPESRPVRRIIERIRRGGGEIGLHGSFASAEGEGTFVRQRERLAHLSGTAAAGVRQHFLKMRPGATQARMRAAGFDYDSTFGFADRNGFRLGVADVVPWWDADRGQASGLDEIPFCWMDRAMSKYQAVEEPGAWVRDGWALAEECRAVEGLWVGVWHPNVHPALGFPGAGAALVDLIRLITGGGPYVSTLSDLQDWRRARRSVRIRGVAPGGEVDAAGTGRPSPALVLEDATGRAREAVRPAVGAS